MANPADTTNPTAKRKCAAEGCDLKYHAKGYCSKHHSRLRRYGDLTTTKRSANGAYMAWLTEHVRFDDAVSCLTWPFAKVSNGYCAGVILEGRRQQAHRAMCILAHGPPPFTDAQAAHSCGKGNKACVNPHHLRWATRLENENDKVIHYAGRVFGTQKLTDKQVLEIFLDPRPYKTIAPDFGISASYVTAIKHKYARAAVTNGYSRPLSRWWSRQR